VALLAKGHKIAVIMRSALRERLNVVYFLGRGYSPLPLAHLTQRMSRNVSVTDAFPGSSVPTVYSRVSIVLLVAFVFCLGVFLTESPIGQLRTAGVGTRALWFSWHLFHLALGIIKAFTGLVP